MFDFDQLRSFILLAEERHFGRAARRSFVSQPAFSRRIQQLEEALGAVVALRDTRDVRLTPAGEALLPRAKALLRDREDALRQVKLSSDQPRGALSLGFDGATTYAVLPRIVAMLRETGEPIDLDFVELGSDAQVDEIMFGRLDIGLIRPRDLPGDMLSERIASSPLALAMPADHPMARLRRPREADIEGVDFVAYSSQGDYLRNLIGQALHDRGIRVNRVHEAARAQSILSLVSTGLGVAIVPGESRLACFDNVTFRPLPFALVAELHAARRAEAANPYVGRMMELLRAHLG